MARLEHLNVTVRDPDATAAMLVEIFGWRLRWQGAAIHGGRSVHVGEADSCLAVYAGLGAQVAAGKSYGLRGGLNHIGIVVDDLDAVEERVKAHGYEPVNHADYEPGRRFYFREQNGIEIEVVGYG